MNISHNKRYDAFTLVELMVVITISLFFVAMVYVFLRFFIFYYGKNETIQETVDDIWLFHTGMMHESAVAGYLEAIKTDSLILCVMPQHDTIRYFIHKKHIIRTQKERRDTIMLPCFLLSFYFNNQTIENGITDRILIGLWYGKNEYTLTFTKEYCPDIWFNFIDTLERHYQ